MEKLLKCLTPYMAEYLEQIFAEDDEYQESVKNEAVLLENLNHIFEPEQAELFEQYFTANCKTTTIRGYLTYQQGMKDMFALLKYLSK